VTHAPRKACSFAKASRISCLVHGSYPARNCLITVRGSVPPIQLLRTIRCRYAPHVWGGRQVERKADIARTIQFGRNDPEPIFRSGHDSAVVYSERYRHFSDRNGATIGCDGVPNPQRGRNSVSVFRQIPHASRRNTLRDAPHVLTYSPRVRRPSTTGQFWEKAAHGGKAHEKPTAEFKWHICAFFFGCGAAGHRREMGADRRH